MSALTGSVPILNTNTQTGLTITITAGVWICSYAIRIFATSGSPLVTAFSSYLSLPSGATTTTTGIAAYSSWTGSAPHGALGALNLALTSCTTIVITATQILTLISSVTQTGGTISYFGTTPYPHTYMMVTRIA